MRLLPPLTYGSMPYGSVPYLLGRAAMMPWRHAPYRHNPIPDRALVFQNGPVFGRATLPPPPPGIRQPDPSRARFIL